MFKLNLGWRVRKKEKLVEINKNFISVPLGDKGIPGERDDILSPQMTDKYGVWEHLQRYKYATKICKGKILDLGCGTGYGSKMLWQKGNEVYGIDISERAIDYAESKYPGPKYICCSAEALPFSNNYFDAVVAFEVIEHVKDYRKAISEIYRVLKKEGILLISTPNLRSLIPRLKHFLFSTPYFSHSGNIYHCHEFYYEEFIDFLRKNQFNIIKTYGQRIPIPKIDWLIKKIPLIWKITIHMGYFFPRFAYTTVVLAKKS